jgi:hypothetical protein
MVEKTMMSYAYCSNNPINRIDPNGKFDTKIGAKLYNWLTGGKGEVRKHANNGEWYVSKQKVNIDKSEITVTATSIYSMFGRTQPSKFKTARNLTMDWVLGRGKQHRVFRNDNIANSFRDARTINQARDYWYREVNAGRKQLTDGVTNFRGRKAWTGGNFGLKGLIKAGLDPMEQMVGSFTPDIISDGKTLTFRIQNTTSFKSLLYGIAPDWSRETFPLGGNIEQLYEFAEPINFDLLQK